MRTLACVALLATLLHSGEAAINCYQCNSHNDSRCAMEPLPESLKAPCSDRDTMCRKIVQNVEFELNGLPPDSRVIRGCGWDETSYKGRCYQRSGFGGRQEVCSCVNDYCNGASLPHPTLLSLLSLAASLLLPALTLLRLW